MSQLTVLDLFSGIGGFSLGLERTGGFKTVAFCEIDPFCRKVVAKHWPGVKIYEDVKTLTLPRGFSDVVTGGFPCQDISIAGAQAGIDGPRSGLWSELCRIIGEVRPHYAVVENVSNLLSGPSEQRGKWFGRVLGDLAEIGFDAEWHCIPASHVGAPHIRDRVWIIAYPQHTDTDSAGSYRAQGNLRATKRGDEQGRQSESVGEVLADTAGPRLKDRQRRKTRTERDGIGAADNSSRGSRGLGRWMPEPDVGRMVTRLPTHVDRLRSLGNTVVPQVVELLGRAILEARAA